MTDFWRWREYDWAAPGADARAARMLTAGVDVGSVSSQAVILADGGSGRLFKHQDRI